MSRMVIKLGGSLYSQPNLRDGLKQFLAKVTAEQILIVPGGGEFAEAVRNLDTIHGLGEKAAHDLALQALWPATCFVLDLLETAKICRIGWNGPGLHVMDHRSWYQLSQRNLGLPETWEVTTDTIAASAATEDNCSLLLLKSIDVHPDWTRAAELGQVDAYFPTIVKQHNLGVYSMNFRKYLEELK
jgi:5-(aminomethyl)-3-furanmethanol phosphate kinase